MTDALIATQQAITLARAIGNEDHAVILATVLADAVAALLDRAGAALEMAAGERAGYFGAVV